MNLDKKEIEAWYAWRWSRSFGYGKTVSPPDLPTEWTTIFPGAVDGSTQGSRPYETEYSAAAVRFFLLCEPVTAWSDENKILCYDELIGKMQRVRATLLGTSDEYVPTGTALPEAKVLSTIRGQFIQSFQPGADLESLSNFVSSHAARLHRLLGHRGSKRAASVVAAKKLLTIILELDKPIGLFEDPPSEFLSELNRRALTRLKLDHTALMQKINLRSALRMSRDWTAADAIQVELEGKGISLMDRDGRTDWRPTPCSHCFESHDHGI